jgi:hypothetical protein
MAADNSISPVLLAISAAQATGIIASTWDLPIGDFALASGFALMGIVARHFSDAGDSLKAGTFDPSKTFKAVALDIPTAPFLGVIVYIGCTAADIEPFWSLGLSLGLGYVGPEYVRIAIQRVLDILIARKTG